jgi:hypothetical protein
MWCDKELVDKRKLRYYKVNPNLEISKLPLNFESPKKKSTLLK